MLKPCDKRDGTIITFFYYIKAFEDNLNSKKQTGEDYYQETNQKDIEDAK